MKHLNKFDLIVVGGGHAGLEAAHIAAKKGCSVVMITMNKNAIGRMSCNPAIGGLAKGQMVREVDVLGGIMGRVADLSGIQFKILNRSKGRSVWSPRAQIDKRVYERLVAAKTIEDNNIKILIGEAVELVIKNGSVLGVVLRDKTTVKSQAVVLTCGTFLSGVLHIGERKISAGRMGEGRSDGITESLLSLGFKTGRLKTGTPPRLNKKTISWDKTSFASGDVEPTPFSYQTKNFNPPNEPCHTIRTNQLVHNIIEDNLCRSPLFSGDISGTGPRYCPSIEDKIHRFAHHDSHTLFLEPEWKDSDQIYLSGFSTSLPEDAQINSLKKIPALKNVELLRPGYAIEYDFFPPAQLKSTLETKDICGLFFAGQINGTSGYEEAAAQGLLAGINASAFIQKTEELVLSRDSSYVGVMIDDLITKDTLEPYRMFTSRAEYRLMLRFSNTEERLVGLSEKHDLLSTDAFGIIKQRLDKKEKLRQAFSASLTPQELPSHITIAQAMPAKFILKRPECSIFDLPLSYQTSCGSMPKWCIKELLLDLESEIKYEGYIKRHLSEIEKLKKNESLFISASVDYGSFPGLSNEAVEKLSLVRPETIGQAMRVSGIRPSDISVLLVNLSR